MRHTNKMVAGLAAIAMLIAAACTKKDDKPLPQVTTSVVKICLDDTTLIRQEDARCEEGLDTFGWRYVSDSPAWPPELPAVGQYIQGGRATPIEPKDVVIGLVPREGGTFPSP